MRKKLYESKYIEAYFTSSFKFLETTWFTEEYMEEEEYRNVMPKYIDFRRSTHSKSSYRCFQILLYY